MYLFVFSILQFVFVNGRRWSDNTFERCNVLHLCAEDLLKPVAACVCGSSIRHTTQVDIEYKISQLQVNSRSIVRIMSNMLLLTPPCRLWPWLSFASGGPVGEQVEEWSDTWWELRSPENLRVSQVFDLCCNSNQLYLSSVFSTLV